MTIMWAKRAVLVHGVSLVKWRTEGGLGFQPPPPNSEVLTKSNRIEN